MSRGWAELVPNLTGSTTLESRTHFSVTTLKRVGFVLYPGSTVDLALLAWMWVRDQPWGYSVGELTSLLICGGVVGCEGDISTAPPSNPL